MSMMQKTISIPRQMDDWVQQQIQGGRFADVSDYFCKLIALDMSRSQVEEQLRSFVDDGIKSGTSSLSIPEIMSRIEKKARSAE